ncbi:MAG: 16S rRNA (cytosine(967)-C(5))-methyltransferase RsmB [Defluviitaleaceae bacterium]|nr:16S rRNA (cytosine(967)-C(5))-methyltransferase RsmB [Defluviitaleaceae bacterium]
MTMRSQREIAVRGLMEILGGDAYGNVALRRILGREEGLSRLDKAFVTEIISGCIRNLIQLDYIIDAYSNTPTMRMKPAILGILRVSVYQMKFMDKVPVFAVCNEATDLAKKMGFAKLSGFVNGLLRNIARNLENIILPSYEADPVEHLRIKYSCQRWIAEHFVEQLGLADADALLAEVCRPPSVSLCVNTGKTTVEKLREMLAAEGVEVSDGRLAKNALTVSKTSDISVLPSFAGGLYHVMDEAAMLAVQAAVTPDVERIIDLCAAPGGKTFAAAYIAPGAEILAGDIHEHKVEMIRRGAERLGLKGITAGYDDATIFDENMRATADLLIVDAPCSGLGTLRRRPDIKLRKGQGSVAELADLQRRILAASWQYVRPGGRLLYATCTISRAENEDMRDWFLATFPFAAADFSDRVPAVAEFATAQDGYIQILPQYFGTDGFFIAIFERVG